MPYRLLMFQRSIFLRGTPWNTVKHAHYQAFRIFKNESNCTSS